MGVRVENGKYEFKIYDGLHIHIDRHGQQWITGLKTGFNALHAIMRELDAARVVLECARNMRERGVCPPDLEAALRKHEHLVDDKEMPSEWTR